MAGAVVRSRDRAGGLLRLLPIAVAVKAAVMVAMTLLRRRLLLLLLPPLLEATGPGSAPSA
jgi:hypothetical protein